MMRIAVIGLGDIARKAYMPVVAAHPGVQPILCTRNPETLAAVARQYRINETYSDLHALVAARPDAAMVHTATQSHAEIVRRLLEAGIPVFVDKPLSYQLAEAEQLLELAASCGVSLTLGFNRRQAPLIQPLGNMPLLIQARLQKNRVRLPDVPRTFIFDDFIHVVDTLRYLAPTEIKNLQVFAQGKPGLLAALDVRWQSGTSMLNGSMNRVSGLTEERLEVFAEDQKWQIDHLTSGIHYRADALSPQPLGFGDWQNTLYKRGFVTMFDAWLEQLKAGKAADYADVLATHELCERLVIEVEHQLSLLE